MSAPYVSVKVNNAPVSAFLDTGAFTSIMADNVYSRVCHERAPRLGRYDGGVYDVNGNPVTIRGVARCQVNTPSGTLRTQMLIYKRTPKMSHQFLVGMDILSHATIAMPEYSLTFSPKKDTNGSTCNRSPDRADDGIYHLKIDFTGSKICGTYRQVLATYPSHLTAPTGEECTVGKPILQGEVENQLNHRSDGTPRKLAVYLTQDTTIPPQSWNKTTVPINYKLFEKTEDLVIHQNVISNDIVLPNMCTRVNNKKITINLVNFSEQEAVLKAGTKLGEAEYLQISPSAINNINEVGSSENYKPLTPEDVNCDNPEVLNELLQILNKYRSVCWLPGESLGHYTGEKLQIKLKGTNVVNKPPYRIAHAHKVHLDKAIDEMLKENIIEPSKSNFNSPLIIVKKQDGGIRPCLDLRELNQNIEPIFYPLPRIADLLNSLGEANIMSTIDLHSAYHQLEIEPEDREKTAFTVGSTKYQYTRVPFGLQSAPGFFARVINTVLYQVLGSNCLAYLDDLILFNADTLAHLETIEAVLRALYEANMKLKVSKCRFFAKTIKFLGYRVENRGMTMDPARVAAINAMPLPTNKRKLQAFLGVANYYRIFIRRFAAIADPLYELLRKNVRFKWTDRQTEAVNTLKGKLASAPIVRFPDYKKSFYIYTDCSNVGMGGTLMQENKGVLHPVAYVSKSLNEAQRRYPATKKEALALVFALEQFRQTILMYPITVYTDHKPLLGVLKNPTKDECLVRWATLIQEYNIELKYIEGKNNIFADALSRLPEPATLDLEQELQNKLVDKNTFCNNLNEYLPLKAPWSELELKTAQDKDSSCQEILDQLRGGRNQKVPTRLIKNIRVVNGTLYVIRSIKRATFSDVFLVPYIPDALMDQAFRLTHQDILAGHKGSERTLKLFRMNFYNSREKVLINNLCNTCDTCVRAKGITKPIPLKVYPIPTRPFHTITSDIIGPLKTTEDGNKYILTFRDYTTRFTILYPLQQKSTYNIIHCLRNVISHFGSPNVLLTDNGREYISSVLSQFLSYYNTKKVEVAPYHPSSAGFAERINREVNNMLRMFVHQMAMYDWDRILPVVQLCINSTYNASLRETPFFALLGFDSASTVLNPPRANYSEDPLSQHMQRMAQIRSYCMESLLKAQASYTKTANRGRHEKDIKEGKRVFARLDKHNPNSKKLDLPISGPFTVLGPSGKAWKLGDIKTGKTYIVHADFIVGRSITRNQSYAQPRPAESTDGDDSDDSPTDSDNPVTVETRQQPNIINQPTAEQEGAPVVPIRRQPDRACKNKPRLSNSHLRLATPTHRIK